jgi:hypothetical protein
MKMKTVDSMAAVMKPPHVPTLPLFSQKNNNNQVPRSLRILSLRRFGKSF